MLHAWRTSLLTTLHWPKLSPNPFRATRKPTATSWLGKRTRPGWTSMATKRRRYYLERWREINRHLCRFVVKRLNECQHSRCLGSTCPMIWSRSSMLTPLCPRQHHVYTSSNSWSKSALQPASPLDNCRAAGPWVCVPGLALWVDCCPVWNAGVCAKTSLSHDTS